ncbi:MAG: hypothetical protein FJX45_18140 [Alphaproteobacteria bacterium]|nr:hypothetical protein [Alphaproteobacteria bacterium]
MSVDLPVKAFALAADIAARRMGETVADLFGDAPSRARYLAIDALISLYPSASQVDIARCFGWERADERFDAAMSGARASRWWRKSDTGGVLKDLRAALGNINADDLLSGAEPIQRLGDDGEECPLMPDARRGDPHDEPRARIYQPRRWRVTLIVSAPVRRPLNLTAALMGDPPPGRREFLAEAAHRGYRPAREDRP